MCDHAIPVKRATVNEFMPVYCEHRATTNAASTAVRDKRRLRTFLEMFGDRLVSRIRVADINAFVAKRKNSGGLANGMGSNPIPLVEKKRPDAFGHKCSQLGVLPPARSRRVDQGVSAVVRACPATFWTVETHLVYIAPLFHFPVHHVRDRPFHNLEVGWPEGHADD